jgi:uncharacterized protein DUF1707
MLGGMEGQRRDVPHGAVEHRDPARLRISDDDRHAVAEVLRHAAGEGRIDLEELDERLEATYAAKTYGDLVPITADLPAAAATPRPVVPPTAPRPPAATGGPSYSSSFAVMSDCSRRGVWEVPAKHNVFTLMGGVTLDLREARFTARETTIEAYAIMAGVDIVVNPWTRVVVEGIGLMGDFSEARSKVEPELTPDSPVVRVRGLALMAGVSVKRKAMPGERPRLLRGRG